MIYSIILSPWKKFFDLIKDFACIGRFLLYWLYYPCAYIYWVY